MRPILLTMQAFGSYGQKTDVDFTKPAQNLFLITGDTGSGKTTIFDAIVFALYGEASSDTNKKDGVELQSQFVGLELQPFVELTFSRLENGQPARYTVRRVPKHKRKKQRGSGTMDASEQVSLLQPDGTEYAGSRTEINTKLQQLVGLTKSQFMQVAMIAQGEFMDMLRAKSSDKKVIFRKLFNTELYQRLIDGFYSRSRGLESELAKVRTVCRTETAHVRIPGDRQGDLKPIRDRILQEDRFSIVDMQDLVAGLEEVTGLQSAQLREQQKLLKQASVQRDAKRDAFTQGQRLQEIFTHLHEAEQVLTACRAREPEMQQAERLATEIAAAYEILPVYQRLQDAQAQLTTAQTQLTRQEEQLPRLQQDLQAAEQAEHRAAEQKSACLESYTAVAQRVEKALKLFAAIGKARQQQKDCRTQLERAMQQQTDCARNLAAFSEQIQQKRLRARELADAPAELQARNSQAEENRSLTDQLQELQKLQQAVREQEQVLDSAQRTYAEKKQVCEQQKQVYDRTREAFLDAQAGFLARELLRPGEPCPVCGSVHHPKPCPVPEDLGDLTRERVEELSRRTARLQQEQERASAQAGSAAALLQERQEHLQTAAEKFRQRLQQKLPEAPEDPEQIAAFLQARARELDSREAQCRERVSLLEQLQAFLDTCQERQDSLQQQADSAVLAAGKARSQAAAADAALTELMQQQEFEREQDARQALSEEQSKKQQADVQYQTLRQKLDSAKSGRDRAQALILQLQESLPRLQQARQGRQQDYQQILDEKRLAEEQWRGLTEQYTRQQLQQLRRRITDHGRQLAQAQGAFDTAKKSIGNRQEPDLPLLLREKQQAEQVLEQAQQQEEILREDCQENGSTCGLLKKQLVQYEQLNQQFILVNSLYRRLSGKNKDEKMDIETYVQRYYLERILYAANTRFREMSAGQFELQMTDSEEAGSGTNRGLDLMVYSAVTGKRREVRTLSGGESFMAALSLALGMADQIQQDSSAIQLDMMFIDEGFGSLDAHSREQAVKVLQKMAGSSRLIGIISHVSELKLAIDDQLAVTKDAAGSHTRWENS